MSAQVRLAVLATVALGLALVPLGAWALVTLGPGLPLLACAFGLIVLPFGPGRQIAMPVMKTRPWRFAVRAVALAVVAIGLAYVVLASEPVARLSGTGLAVGVGVALLWLRYYATSSPTAA